MTLLGTSHTSAPDGRSAWALHPAVMSEVAAALRLRQTGKLPAPSAEDLERPRPEAARTRSGQRIAGAVAVLPLRGVIMPRPSFLSWLFGGGGGLVEWMDDFRAAVNDDDVGSILIDIDSPGGRVDLVPEAAEEIRAARGKKPIVAIANTLAASAAYWIGSQADELIVTPSGDVGSIGVYMVHEDWSGFNETMGVLPTYVSAGKYKIEGNPDQPLSDDARAAWQQDVDDIHGSFIKAVAAGRGANVKDVRDGFGEGRVLNAKRALEAGMVDSVEPFEKVLARLVSGTKGTGGRRGRAAAEATVVNVSLDGAAIARAVETEAAAIAAAPEAPSAPTPAAAAVPPWLIPDLPEPFASSGNPQ